MDRLMDTVFTLKYCHNHAIFTLVPKFPKVLLHADSFVKNQNKFTQWSRNLAAKLLSILPHYDINNQYFDCQSQWQRRCVFMYVCKCVCVSVCLHNYKCCQYANKLVNYPSNMNAITFFFFKKNVFYTNCHSRAKGVQNYTTHHALHITCLTNHAQLCLAMLCWHHEFFSVSWSWF